MKKYLRDFCERYAFPQKATETFLSAYDVLSKNDKFNALYESFYADEQVKGKDVEEICDDIVKEVSLHPHTVKFLFYMCLTKEAKEKYKQAGISEEIFWDTMEDFSYKLKENYEVHGVWGFFVTTWYYNILHLRIFKLGRLEYVIGEYKGEDVEVGGVTVKAGMKVINIHIPSSGEPFDRNARIASYDQAYRFFRDVMGEDVTLFMCNSWLLYPANREILGPKSNVVSFINDFKIISSGEYEEDRRGMWRVFGAKAELPVDQLPCDTSMQRGYAQWLKKGNKPGYGVGLFVYDVVNQQTLK